MIYRLKFLSSRVLLDNLISEHLMLVNLVPTNTEIARVPFEIKTAYLKSSFKLVRSSSGNIILSEIRFWTV